MNDLSLRTAAHAFFDSTLDKIPMTRAMQLVVHDYDGARLALSAPLAPNINDKGNAFGGSLAGALTLAGWGLVALQLHERGYACDIYVQDSTIRYLAPVWDDFVAIAELADGESWDNFNASLAARGRARIEILCRTPGRESGDACTLRGRFVAIVRSQSANTP